MTKKRFGIEINVQTGETTTIELQDIEVVEEIPAESTDE
tara:strand:- start:880 stop:996 length:117 start_codon:yes stop_codon:yes gene_type:complete